MAWLPREGLPSRCPGCTSSKEAESESESWKTENSPTFKYFCRESWEAFCTSWCRWFVLSEDYILFSSYQCGIKFCSQLQVDFLLSSFLTKSTVLSQDISSRELRDSFVILFFFSVFLKQRHCNICSECGFSGWISPLCQLATLQSRGNPTAALSSHGTRTRALPALQIRITSTSS